MELTDIIPVESWRKLAEDIYKRFGFNSCIYNKDNLIIHPPVGWANEVCPLIKAGDSRVICASSQQNFSRKLRETREPVIDECEAGFLKFLAPIFMNGDYLGSAGGCGCLLTDNKIDTFYISKAVGKPEEEIIQLITTIPKISRDRMKEALSYLQDHIRKIMEASK